MSKSKRLISILLAAVMLVTTLSVGVSAQYYDYKNPAILAQQGLDSQDKPIMTINQYSSMVLDEVDRMLKESNKILNEEISVITIKLDLRSVDSVIQDLQILISTVDKLIGVGGGILGDLGGINFDAVTLYNSESNPRGIPLRTTPGKTDMDILKSLLRFLADNAGILSGIVDGSLNLGALSSAVDLSDFDLPQMAKELIYEFAYPDAEVPEPVTETIDSMLQTVINALLDGTYDLDSDTYREIIADYGDIFAEIKPYFNITSSDNTVYEVLKQMIQVAYNDFAVPFFNEGKGNRLIRDLCGVEYDENNPDDPGDESDLNSIAEVINIDFVLREIDFDHLYGALEGTGVAADGYTIFDCVNEIIGQIVEDVINPDLGITWLYEEYTSPDDNWLEETNKLLDDNLANAAKVIIKEFGDGLFDEGITLLSDTEIDALTTHETFAYVLRSLLNASFDDIIIPDSADTMCEVLNYTAMYLVGEVIPEAFDRNGSAGYYPEMDMTSTDTLLEMLGDYLAFVIMRYLNVDDIYDYSDSFNGVMEKLGNWAIDNYGGLFSDYTWNTSNPNVGWRTINSILFKIIPITWLGNDTAGNQRNDIYKILRKDIIENLLNLDFYKLFSLFRRNMSQNSELNKPLNYMLVNRVFSIINYIFPGSVKSVYTNFEDVVNPVKLKALLNDLLVSLSDNANVFLPSLIPLAAQLLGLSDAQEFGYPETNMNEYVRLAETPKPTFTIFNGSEGINTGRTTINTATGALSPVIDGLYKYEIVSLTCRLNGAVNNAVSVTRYTDANYASPLSNNIIDGGTFGYYQINGLTSAMNNSLLHIVVKYNIKDENGVNMTSNPLQIDLFTYIAMFEDDSDVPADASQQGNMHRAYTTASYFGKGATLGDLADVEINVRRTAASKDDTGAASYGHTQNATVSVGSVAVDSRYGKGADNVAYVTGNTAWTQETNEYGGDWDFNPYTVSAAGALVRPSDGMYTSNIELNVGATKAGSPNTRINFTHRAYFYDDFGFYAAYESAAESNRQSFNYGSGNYTYTYVNAFGNEVSETVNGVEAWNNYETALENAAAVALRPRQIGSFGSTHAGRFEELKLALDDAIARLEVCAVSSGVTGISAALLGYCPPKATKIVDGDKVDLEYWEDGYVYWEREDYLDFTYRNFREEKNAAEDLIEDASQGRSIDSVKATYTLHRLNLFGERLIRVRANTSALSYEVAQAQAAGYNQADYFAEAWSDYQTALTFAQSVLTEPLGESKGQAAALGWLITDGLRQSKVNMAREQLLTARKKLYPAADYTEFTVEYNTANAVDTDLFTTESLTAFNAALEAARDMKKDYSRTDANQAKIDEITERLNAARLALIRAADYSQLKAALASALAKITEAGGTIEAMLAVYSEATVQAFRDAYNAAKAILPGLANTPDNQALINSAYDLLAAAIAGLKAAVEKGIAFVENFGVSQNFIEWLTDPYGGENINYMTGELNRFITGFDMDPNGMMGGLATADGFVEGVGGASAEIIYNDMGMSSTGARLVVTDDATGAEIATYDFVAFGDLDGDGVWSADVMLLDADLMNDEEYTWYNSYSTPMGFAADVNKDGAVGPEDVTFLDNACLGIYVIGQEYDIDNPGYMIEM